MSFCLTDGEARHNNGLRRKLNTKGNLFLKERNGLCLINVSFLQLLGRGRSCHPGHYILCFYDMKARHKASLLTATRKLKNIFRWWAGLDAGCW